jgi:hypothetical protein
MATLNIVEDYGAVGDGRTDDSRAIQDAINATSDGDTVLIPETEQFYRIYDDTTGTSTTLLLENAADNVTIRGESPKSKLVMDSPDGKAAIMGCESMSNASWTTMDIEQLVLDGGDTEFDDPDSNCMAWRVDEDRTGYDITIEDVLFQNSGGSDSGFTMAYSSGISRMTIRNCTARNCGNHGFDPIGTGEGSPSNPEIQFIDVQADNNSGIGIDFHSGNHLVDGFYGTGNENGLKAGSAGGPVNHITLKNLNHRNSGNKGFYQTFDTAGWSLYLENVLFVGHVKDGLELREECDATLTGTLMVDDCAGVDDNIQVLEGSTLNASNGTIVSQNAANGVGFKTWNAGDVSIGDYYYYNNADGALDTDGRIRVNNQVNEEQPEIAVPGPDDVGAFSSGSTTDNTDSEEDSDNSETESDDPIFEDWTPRWESGNSSWTVNSTSSNVEDNILELSADSAGRHGLSCDSIGTATDVDLLGLVRVPSDDDRSSSWCRLIGRGAGSAGNETGYFVSFRDVPSFGISKYVGGSSTGLVSEPVDFSPGNWVYVRFNISGTELKARYWGVSQPEPDDWLLEATDDEISESGWVGVGGWSTDTQQWDAFSVATGGDAAQLVGSDSMPTVAVTSPVDGDRVAGTEQIQVTASDAEDGDDSLTAEYRIDNETWTPLSYNADSGLYEDNWDTTAVTDGDHTLEAAVVDSAGNESTTAISVTTDNAGTRPSVESLSTVEVETENEDAEFDVDWQVSDADGDLDTVELELVQGSNNSLQDSATVSVSGENGSGTTRLVAVGGDGENNRYTVSLRVSDSKGNTESSTTSITEFEETEPPEIHRLSVSESGRPDPHAEISVLWDVSDPDGTLASVDIDVSTAGKTVQGVSWTLSGPTASDTDSFKIKRGDGKTFNISLTVTDAAGEATTQEVSVTA